MTEKPRAVVRVDEQGTVRFDLGDLEPRTVLDDLVAEQVAEPKVPFGDEDFRGGLIRRYGG